MSDAVLDNKRIGVCQLIHISVNKIVVSNFSLNAIMIIDFEIIKERKMTED